MMATPRKPLTAHQKHVAHQKQVAAKKPAKKPAAKPIDQKQMAAEYGWALAVLQSDPELLRLFNRAVAAKWTGDRFTAEVRATKWYQGHAERWRATETERLTDPSTFKANVQAKAREIAAAFAAAGVEPPSGLGLLAMGREAYMNGWDAATLNQHIAAGVQTQAAGAWSGQAGMLEDQLRAVASENGVAVTDDWIARQVAAALGAADDAGQKAVAADAEAWIRQQAASAFPAWAEQINNGQSVNNLAASYKQSMANILELPGEQLSLQDPTLRSALQAVTPDGKPSVKPLYQFEAELRKDPRWMKTNNAKTSTANVVMSILSDFGFNG